MHHLVYDVDVRLIRRNTHFGSNTESVDGAALRKDCGYFEFVETAAGEDLDIVQSGVVENGSYLPAQGRHVTAVEANADK